MFDAIRAVQSVTDAPYHRPQPVETRSNKPVFSLDLAAPVVPDVYSSAPTAPAYNASALSVIQSAILHHDYPVDARKIEDQRRRADLRIGSHAAHYSVLALIDGMMQEGH
jgi:hypothetical protein